jgi:hypothetical protein
VRSYRQTAAGMAELMESSELKQFRAHAAALDNRAIFEIPEIFENILNRSQEKLLAGSRSEI